MDRQALFLPTTRSDSPSSSSVITVKASESPRRESASRNASKMANGARRSSSATRLSSGTGSKQTDKDANTTDSRWSQSSTSTHGANEHRRHSSFSKRFSFGSSNQLAAPQEPTSRRTPSPSKKKRPVDIQTGLSVFRSANVAGQGDQIPVQGTIIKSKILDPSYDAPRTPLLYMGQISATDDTRPSANSEYDQPKQTSEPSRAQPGPRHAGWGSSTDSSHSSKQDASIVNTIAQQRQTSSKSRRDRDKKTTLSKALQRANEAVQFDNAQDFMAAVEAYEEACEYLRQVLNKTTSDGDKRKLSTIRTTYIGRIRELEQLDSEWRSPTTNDASEQDDWQASVDQNITSALDGTVDGDEGPLVETNAARNPVQASDGPFVGGDARSTTEGQRGPLLKHYPPEEEARTMSKSAALPELSSSALKDSMKLAPPSNADMPPPLSPRRPPPPVPPTTNGGSAPPDVVDQYDPQRESYLMGVEGDAHLPWSNKRQSLSDAMSQSSSRHSVSSVNGLRRKHLRTHSTSTEAEFDAALDAAVEAAYDEGYVPYNATESLHSRDYLARASVIEPQLQTEEYFAQRNSIVAAANARTALNGQDRHSRHSSAQFSDAPSEMNSEDEERLLDQATSMTDTGNVDSQTSKANPPRQSDSSSSSARTWGSSVASSLNTAGSPLTTVDEDIAVPASNLNQPPAMPPPAPPPTGALPSLPGGRVQSASARPWGGPVAQAAKPVPTITPALPQSPSVQDRRSLLGQGTKKLKIETTVGSNATMKPSLPNDPNSYEQKAPVPVISLPVLPKTAPVTFTSDSRPSPGSSTLAPSASSSFRLMSSPSPTPFQCQFPEEGSSSTSSIPPSLTPAFSSDSGSFRPSPLSASPNAQFQDKPSLDRGLTQSSSSLTLHQKSHLTPEPYDNSPATPMSFSFGTAQALNRPLAPNTPAARTPSAQGRVAQASISGNNVNLFANEIHSSDALSRSESRIPHPPRPLEPCPTSQLLRPFWLMRRFYQTIAHPRGGYLSNKVFIPREVWKVKNVKLKNVEDKISNCDLLTAALLKLSTVDTLDADAVLEEMQTFETVLDQAQANLSKKLGHEVGVQNISSLFKEAPPIESPVNNDASPPSTGDTNSTGGNAPKSNSKSYLSSWRKLRNKNSSAHLPTAAATARDTSSKEGLTMSTIPMTDMLSGSSNRATKKDGGTAVADLKTDGPHAQYMSAVARLCDAVQILDRIARQVEDPGLKHTSPTHVGLELSSRHAAEFFGFYICRFVLQDISMLADKFVKRASEWVLS